MLALMCMMPLLCLYADLLGILGGAVASWISFSISPVLYMSQVAEAVRLSDLLLGVTKGFVFGILIALAGCYYGICAGRSSSAVGQAATSAVVSSIVLIVLADAFFSIIAQHLNL
jgi:phospholipid/cholesterol/gamma-HCH transport system permease protein